MARHYKHQEEQHFYQKSEEDFFSEQNIFDASDDEFMVFSEQDAFQLVPNPEDFEESISFLTTIQELKKYGIYEIQYTLLLIIYWSGSFYFDYLNYPVLHLAFLSSVFYFGVKLCEDYYVDSQEQTLMRMCSHHFLIILLMMSTLLGALMFFEGNAY